MARRRRKPRPLWASALFVIVVAALILILRLVEDIGPERALDDRFLVSRILDGDTMELQGGDRLRLLALDTPEEGEPLHDEAAELLGRLSLGAAARIEYPHRRRDRYGRLLGFLFVDTLFVNKTLIDSGLAYVYLFPDTDLESNEVHLMLEAQRSAIARRVGLWSIPHAPEDRYINKPGSFRLHRPSCRSLGDLIEGRYQSFSTREEGLATGLSPCRNCKP